jgi:hypothetical protein
MGTAAKPSVKALQNKILPLCDRAFREQATLAKAFDKCRRILLDWVVHARMTAGAVDALTTNLSRCIQPFLKDVSVKADGLQSIVNSFFSAEESRIPLDIFARGAADSSASKLRTKDSAEVSPMDMLSRGTLGPMVAELVNSLRAYCGSNVTDIIGTLHTLHKDLKSKVDVRIKEFETMKTNINRAADVSVATFNN